MFKIPISKAAAAMEPEEAFIYLAKGMELKKRGVDVVSFGIGQPDFKPPSFAIEAVKKAVDEYSGYGPAGGMPELREAVAEYLNSRYGAGVEPGEVMITVGGKAAVFLAMAAVLEPCDEVIIPDPGYPAYASVARFMGAIPVYLRLSGENGYRVRYEDVERLVGPNTKMIVLNYPENPVGTTMRREDVDAILDLAEDRGIAVLSDEIYDNFVYDGGHYSVLQHEGWRSVAMYANGFSKTFAMTGWRLGYLVADKAVIERAETMANNIYSCPVTFAQVAAAEALRHDPELKWFEPIKEEFRARRDLIYEKLTEIPGVKAVKPEGAFYAFPDFSGVIERKRLRDERELADRLLYEAHVVVLPGSAFPGRAGRGHLRFSFATGREDIERGMERVKEWVES